ARRATTRAAASRGSPARNAPDERPFRQRLARLRDPRPARSGRQRRKPRAMPTMSVETNKELDDFFRSMRQAYNSRDLKLYRSHFWTNERFVNLDASGRVDLGWGSYEEIL